MEPLALSVNETAKVLGISRVSVYNLLNENKLRGIKIGRRTVVSVLDIEAFVANAEEYR